MKTRTIWILAAIFASIATLALYEVLLGKPNTQSRQLQEQTKPVPVVAKNTSSRTSKPKPFEIEQGKRAVSIAVNDVQGISGNVAAGDYVDVIAMVPPPQGENVSAQILLQNIKVLTVGLAKGEVAKGDVAKNADSTMYRTVTLEVLPFQGESLALALQKGSVALMLRRTGDHSIIPAAMVTQEQLNKGVNSK